MHKKWDVPWTNCQHRMSNMKYDCTQCGSWENLVRLAITASETNRRHSDQPFALKFELEQKHLPLLHLRNWVNNLCIVWNICGWMCTKRSKTRTMINASIKISKYTNFASNKVNLRTSLANIVVYLCLTMNYWHCSHCQCFPVSHSFHAVRVTVDGRRPDCMAYDV